MVSFVKQTSFYKPAYHFVHVLLYAQVFYFEVHHLYFEMFLYQEKKGRYTSLQFSQYIKESHHI